MIRNLNSRKNEGERECKVCRRIARLTDDKCQVCLALEKMSGSILYENYFTVMSEPDKDALPLPENRYLAADTKESLLKPVSYTHLAMKSRASKAVSQTESASRRQTRSTIPWSILPNMHLTNPTRQLMRWLLIRRRI